MPDCFSILKTLNIDEPTTLKSARKLMERLVDCFTPEQNNFTPSHDTRTESVLDTTKQFTTDEIFNSREALVNWSRVQGRKCGIVVVIKRSDGAGKIITRRARVTLGCERGGHYIKKSNVDSDDEQPMNSKANLKGLNIGPGDEWKVEVICGVHNHHSAKYLEGHSYAGRLSKEENNLLMDMSKSLVRPKDILYTIKRRDGKNVTTMKTIYNARHKSRVVEKAVDLRCNYCYVDYLITNIFIGIGQMTPIVCVMKACKGILKKGEKWEQFIVLWNMLVSAKTEVDYERNLLEMDRIFEGKYSKALDYVKVNWLKEYKDRFVAVWTDTCMHFGNTTSNRAESAHSQLKRQLGTSQCNFETSWAKIHAMLVLQHTEIKASFEKSQSFVQHEFNRVSLLKDLIGNDPDTKRHIGMKLQEIMDPKSSTLREPQVKIKTKGRPSNFDKSTRRLPSAFELVESDCNRKSLTLSNGVVYTKPPPKKRKKQTPPLTVHKQQIVNPEDLTQQYNEKLPAAIRPFIMGAKDVKSDGNCGFRAIAGLLGYGENSWRKSVESKREVEYRLDYFDDYPLEDRWMLIPEMGYLIANCYNVVLMHFSNAISLMFLPTESHPLPEYQRREISIRLVEKHFVQLHLQPHHPMPPVINRWLDISNLKAFDWYSPYRDRIDNWKELTGSFDVHLEVY
ncbi:unnamed protein product [Prunus armeniaca]